MMRVTTLALFFFIFALITLSWGMTRAEELPPTSPLALAASLVEVLSPGADWTFAAASGPWSFASR